MFHIWDFLAQSIFFCMHAADGELRVWRMTGSGLNQLLVVTEVAGLWKRFEVDITSAVEYQVRLSRCIVLYSFQHTKCSVPYID